MNSRKIAAIIVAAGEGTRLPGSCPKAYRVLHGKPLWRHSYDVFNMHPAIGEIMLVVNPNHLSQGQPLPVGEVTYVEGGKTRQESVAKGLKALEEKGTTHVLIHDAARPFLDRALIDRVLEGLEQHPAVIPAIPVKDTIKRMDEGRVVTPDRHSLCAAQTPQGFRYDTILQLHKKYTDRHATDDAQLAEWAGIPVHVVAGDEANKKITTAEDLPMEARTGMGFDVHRFIPGDSLRLCGVDIPSNVKLEGHSDADVGLHALTDAILGALALGDIGMHFSPNDLKWKGADSIVFLRHACALATERNARITHIDLTLICEKPKINPYRDAMRSKVAEILNLPVDAVSVKATTTEGLGFTGRGEGIAAQAVVTVLQQFRIPAILSLWNR